MLPCFSRHLGMSLFTSGHKTGLSLLTYQGLCSVNMGHCTEALRGQSQAHVKDSAPGKLIRTPGNMELKNIIETEPTYPRLSTVSLIHCSLWFLSASLWQSGDTFWSVLASQNACFPELKALHMSRQHLRIMAEFFPLGYNPVLLFLQV